jgi:NAD(P)-dependent dehydrogenase (short-subunit alcohol dehydrogenase family)
MTRLQDKVSIITGAAQGIGLATALKFAAEGAIVVVCDLRQAAIDEAVKQCQALGAQALGRIMDVTDRAMVDAVVAEVKAKFGRIDVLVNNAGINPFGLLQDQTAAQVDLSFAVNVQAPIQLCRELLPHLRSLPAAHIVNMGSVFGSIGFPGYAVYSATKFAMRGFSEALGRELADTGVRVHCLAPRATRTRINSPEVERMNAELGVAMDDPAVVGAALCAVLGQGNSFSVVGWPEKLFARVNAVLPRLVDGALRKQLPIIRRYAAPKSPAAGETP